MLEVDGSHLEGGGQIVRTAIALSAITGKSVHIFNIRKGRKKPGLKSQHLEGINAAAKICCADIVGAQLNSPELVFKPTLIKGGRYLVDTKTAGAITLVLQTLTPLGILADRPLKLTIKGGTAVPFSPTIENFQHIFCAYLKRMGISIFVEIKRHGFYPKGGGEVSVSIEPGKLQGINLLERGSLQRIDVLSIASEHLRTAKVAERMISGFQSVVPNAHFKYHYVEANSPGCFIHSQAHFENCVLGADALGRPGKRAEDVGKAAGQELNQALDSGAPVDLWIMDQLIPYLALAAVHTGQILKIKISQLTKHAETNMWVVKKFLPVEFKVEGNIITCLKIEP